MRQRMWRSLFAAAVSVLALAGSASAQNQPPTLPVGPGPVRSTAVPIPQVRAGNSAVTAQPATGPTALTVPSVPAAAAGTPIAPTPGTVVVPGDGGCASCGTARPGATATRGFVMNTTGGYVGTDCQFGRRCNNGCGSLKSDLGFFFGPCRSFFDPCGPRGLECGRCHTPVYGHGAMNGPFNPCVYDSYLNH
ncbi:MAG: hypothetical protein JWO38_7451 [Gemmataceae bacterium]|nr:hypothetical protein [Gemmataceae bacterium]